MKRILAILLVFAITVSILASCNKDEKPAETTAADTAKTESPAIRESKAYPNALTVSAYSLLTNNEKIVYEAIAKLISSPEPSKAVTLNKSVATDTFDMVMDIFRANFATHSAVLEKITFTDKDKNITAVMIADDFDDEAFKNEYDTVMKKADEIICSIPLGLSDKEIVFELVDYLTANIEKLDDGDPTTVYNALLDKKANSEGYAKAFDLLLKKTGIRSFTVYGYDDEYIYDNATGFGQTVYKIPETKHYWNYLCLWNKWYEIDLSKLHDFWCEGGELLLNIDNLNGYNGLAYYYYKGSLENMKVPITAYWKDTINEFRSAEEIITMLEKFDLYDIWRKSVYSTLSVKLKTDDEVDKLLEFNKKCIKDKIEEEYILYLNKIGQDQRMVSITVIKKPEENFTPFYAEICTFNSFYVYKENGNYYDEPPIYANNLSTICYSVPDYWLGTEEYLRFVDSNYPGFSHAMTFIRLIQVPYEFVLNEKTTEALNFGVPYLGEYHEGITSNGVEYTYYSQPGNVEGEIIYYVFMRILKHEVLSLYITETNEDTAMKVIDSIRFLE